MKKSLRSFGIIAMAAVLALAACGGGSGSSGGSSDGGGGGGGVKVALPNDGDGLSAVTAYKISNAGQLKAIAKEVNDGNPDYTNAYYELTNDIDLSPFSSGTGWEPIGNDISSPFSGTFDGGGFVISGLAINDDTLEYVGLFGLIYDATVENLGVEIASITGKDFVGGVAGVVIDGVISNCHTTGNVKGNYFVGGVVGAVSGDVLGGVISNCSATGNVTGAGRNVGGVAGAVIDGSISDCHATGNVTGADNNVGGVAGAVIGDVLGGGAITNSYATGDIEGINQVGGLAGGVINGSISDCHATGDVTGAGENVGGATGIAENSTISNTYATGNVNGAGDNVGGIAGDIIDGSAITNSHATGDVTGTGNNVGGVAGHANSSDVKNSYATGSIIGGAYVGGVVGNVFTSNVENCYATGNVKGDNWIGGVAGYLQHRNSSIVSTVSNCYATGEIEGKNQVGGIAGSVSSYSNAYNCAALNSKIVREDLSPGTLIGRVIGSVITGHTGLISNNVAYVDMGGGALFGIRAHDNKDGADISKLDATTNILPTTNYYSALISPGPGLGWDFDGVPPIWKWGGTLYPLPILYWQTETPAFPSHLQTP